jgi:hypothetical protein
MGGSALYGGRGGDGHHSQTTRVDCDRKPDAKISNLSLMSLLEARVEKSTYRYFFD